MRANYLFWVLLALIAGLLAAMLTHQFMTRNQEAPPAAKASVPMFTAEVVPIVVAAIPVPGNILIDDPGRWFRVIRMAKGDAPADAFADFGPLRGLHLKRPLAPYQPLLRSDVETRAPLATAPVPTSPVER